MTVMDTSLGGVGRKAVAALEEAFASCSKVEAWQEAAMRRLRVAGLPDRRSEAWRYTDLIGALEENTAHFSSTKDSSRLEISLAETALPEGVALEKGDAPEPLFAEQQSAGVSADVNLALAREGFVLRVKEGVACPGVIHIRRRGGGHGRGRVELGAGASARILESHVGDGSPCLRTHLLECRLGEGARLRHECVDAPGAGGVSLGRLRVEMGGSAELECGLLGVGGRLGRREYMCDFAAPEARVRLRALSLARGGELRDVQAEMNHRVGECVSDTLVKSVLADGAQGVFQGMVRVAAGASGSDGRQISKALLLGESARMNAKPELEVFNDDVECAHGSAIGSLDAEALFYLRARGIGEAEARRMLVAAFLVDVLEGVEDGEALRAHAQEWLDAG